MDKSILVVDDDPSVQEVFRRMLVRNGYEVHTAANGRLGLREIERKHPDLVIVDMIMPDIGGIEFLTRLSKAKSTIPVIAASGNTFGKQFLRSATLLGAKAVLSKPFSEAELLGKVLQALQ